MNKRLHAYYSGSVQGVGFRFTVERIASQLGIDGWVRNLSDGRVEAVCEASETDLVTFLGRVKDAFGGYIREVETVWESATGEFAGFDIR